MIFRCSDQGCGYFGEGPRLPEFCPRCGKRMLQAAEGEMTGDDWSALGVFWISRPDGKERGLACFRRSAGMGSGWGTCHLGICMEQGLGVEADPRQAFWLYQQAVEMGSLSAVCNLGVCYEQGIGTTSDQKKAVELFRRAAEHGSSRGQRLLARCLEQGLGLPQDQKAALEWLRTSALQGDASSQAELARHYEFGVGTEISPKQAVQWYRRAAQAGDAPGDLIALKVLRREAALLHRLVHLDGLAAHLHRGAAHLFFDFMYRSPQRAPRQRQHQRAAQQNGNQFFQPNHLSFDWESISHFWPDTVKKL